MWNDPVRKWKPVAFAGAILAALLLAGGAWWWRDDPALETAADEPLPVPPIPPRIAQGADYDRCLAMLATDPNGARALADTWTAAGGGDGATHCSALATIAFGEPEAGAAMLDTLAGHSGASGTARAAVYAQAGQAWLIAGSPDHALASTTLALSLTPDNADLLVDRSMAEGALERYQQAADDLSRALDLEPGRVDALVFRASAWRQLDRLDLAQADIDQAVGLDPDDADALLERGILRQRQGDRAGARRDWEQAVRLAPDSATADLAQQNLALLDAGPERK